VLYSRARPLRPPFDTSAIVIGTTFIATVITNGITTTGIIAIPTVTITVAIIITPTIAPAGIAGSRLTIYFLPFASPLLPLAQPTNGGTGDGSGANDYSPLKEAVKTIQDRLLVLETSNQTLLDFYANLNLGNIPVVLNGTLDLGGVKVIRPVAKHQNPAILKRYP